MEEAQQKPPIEVSGRKRGFIAVAAGNDVYYEAMSPLSPEDIEVPLCPGEGFFLHQGEWYRDRRGPRSAPEDTMQAREALSERIVRKKEKEESTSFHLGQDTKLSFTIKDLLVVCSFIVSLTITWTNTDSRISRLEERVTQDMVKRIESIERKQDETAKKTEDAMKSIGYQIADLERIVLNGQGRQPPAPASLRPR
jgi:hypothetical protein